MKNNRSTINKIYYGFLASGMIEVIFGALLLLFMQVYDLSYSEAGVLLSAKFLGNFLSFIVFMVLLGTAAFGGIVFPFGIGRVAETLGIKRGMILIGVAMAAFLVTTIINFFIKKESSSSSLIICYNPVLLRLGLRI